MGIVPENRLERIQFYENHITPWGANFAAIGLTADDIADLVPLVAAARNAYNAAETARLSSKAATAAFYEAVRAMHSGPGAGADLIKTIQTFASSTDNPGVYVLAEIPAPLPPSEAPAPGTPFDLTVGLLPVGALELKWKCNNPANTAGTVYEVQRSINGEGGGGAFSTIGITGSRSFIDETLPSSSSPVFYRLTAVRSTKRGVTAQFIVQFGNGGVGAVSATSVPSKEMKLAA